MKTNARKYVGKVLPDGHLSLPEDTVKEVGSVFEVVLIPLEETLIYTVMQSL